MRVQLGSITYEVPRSQVHSIELLFDTANKNLATFYSLALARYGIDLEACVVTDLLDTGD